MDSRWIEVSKFYLSLPVQKAWRSFAALALVPPADHVPGTPTPLTACTWASLVDVPPGGFVRTSDNKPIQRTVHWFAARRGRTYAGAPVLGGGHDTATDLTVGYQLVPARWDKVALALEIASGSAAVSSVGSLRPLRPAFMRAVSGEPLDEPILLLGEEHVLDIHDRLISPEAWAPRFWLKLPDPAEAQAEAAQALAALKALWRSQQPKTHPVALPPQVMGRFLQDVEAEAAHAESPQRWQRVADRWWAYSRGLSKASLGAALEAWWQEQLWQQGSGDVLFPADLLAPLLATRYEDAALQVVVDSRFFCSRTGAYIFPPWRTTRPEALIGQLPNELAYDLRPADARYAWTSPAPTSLPASTNSSSEAQPKRKGRRRRGRRGGKRRRRPVSA
jgi:hypothetical protein